MPISIPDTKAVLGAWAWGNDNSFGPDIYNEEKLRAVFEKAWELGLRTWDTAYVYGMGNSEKILGELLKGKRREDYILSDKFTPQHADPESENAIVTMFENSCRLLGTDYIDIYWIHNPKDFEKWTEKAVPLLKDGRIKSLGVSNFNLEELKRAESILEPYGLGISGVQNHFSLLCRSSYDSGIVDYCSKTGKSFFSYMILEQGALTGRFGSEAPFPEKSMRAKNYNKVLARYDKLNDKLSKIANGLQVTLPELMIIWALKKGTVPIIGVTKTEHVDSLHKALSVFLGNSDILDENSAKYLEDAADESGLRTIRMWEKIMQ